MQFDYPALKFWLDVANWITVIAMWIYVFFTNRHKANRSAIKEVKDLAADLDKRFEKRVTETNGRLNLMEEKISNQIDEDDVHRIYDKIDKVSDTVNKLEGESRQLIRTLQIIEQHLMERSK